MSKFKVLVIDDEEKRNEKYNSVLCKHFDVKIINSINDVKQDDIKQSDLLIMDVCLGDNGDVFDLICQMHIDKPTILISGKWLDDNNKRPNDYVLRVPQYKNIINLLEWNSFLAEDDEVLSEQIYYNFCRTRNIEVVSDEVNDFVILHISDLQFGGNLSGASCNDNVRVANKLCDLNIKPNLVVITGDIANQGKKEEYDEALKWIERLAEELWRVRGDLLDDQRKRIIIVPGNHDAEISVCATDLYKFKFGANEMDSYIKQENHPSFSHQKLAFYNFMEFAAKLYHDKNWLTYMDKAIYSYDRFINYGLNIFNFNSVYKIDSRNCENRFDNFYCDLSDINSELLQIPFKGYDNNINMLIMHNPPKSYRRDGEKGENSWNVFQTLIEDNRISLCLYGHTHDDRKPYILGENGGPYCEKMICVPAPSLRLAAASRTEDAARGFNILELKKEAGVIKSVNVRKFELNKACVIEKSLKEFSFE